MTAKTFESWFADKMLPRITGSRAIVRAMCEAGWNGAVDSQRVTSVEMDGRTLPVVDWNELSRRGVLVRINDMLRAEGLAVMRVVETGTSPGAMVLEVSDVRG